MVKRERREKKIRLHTLANIYIHSKDKVKWNYDSHYNIINKNVLLVSNLQR